MEKHGSNSNFPHPSPAGVRTRDGLLPFVWTVACRRRMRSAAVQVAEFDPTPRNFAPFISGRARAAMKSEDPKSSSWSSSSDDVGNDARQYLHLFWQAALQPCAGVPVQ
uniref:Uncharacterized protein n=1 Tax=Anopheles culicifacies TaxID=139723 RepID=A0A182M0G3_9DIPT